MSKRIIIAAGGTGGHLFPGIAIAEAFMEKDPENKVLFISTGKPLESAALSEAGFQHESLSVEGIRGRGLLHQILSVLKLPKAFIRSLRIFRRFKPDLFIGIGSYVTGPAAAGAWLSGVRIALCEQNATPGITNRLLSFPADRIYVSFKETAAGSFSPGSFSRLSLKKIRVTGNPIRKVFLSDHVSVQRLGTGNELKTRFTLSSAALTAGTVSERSRTEALTVLVVGGSQGAHSINMAMKEAITCLKQKDHFFFIHQTGAQDEQEVENAYIERGISATVKPFFNDMAAQYRQADLVICRAGATTMAEVTAMGKVAIFIPYPFASGNHQAANAEILAAGGAAEMILQKDLSGSLLAEKIEYYASHPENLREMALRAKTFSRPDAAQRIVADCYGN